MMMTETKIPTVTLWQYVEENGPRLYRQRVYWSPEEGFLSDGSEPEAVFGGVPKCSQLLPIENLDWLVIDDGAEVTGAWFAGE